MGTAATIGASSFFVGQILALTSIEIGVQAVLMGRGLATTAIQVDGGGLVSLTASLTHFNLTLGACEQFSALGASMTFAAGQTVIATGSIGISTAGFITGNYSLQHGSTYLNTAPATTCATQLVILYNTASTAYCEYYLANADLSGITLTPGEDCIMHF